ncbi:MAG: hypothetical protein WBN22_09755, partial [Verrucomicrobiia bacterium]
MNQEIKKLGKYFWARFLASGSHLICPFSRPASLLRWVWREIAGCGYVLFTLLISFNFVAGVAEAGCLKGAKITD